MKSARDILLVSILSMSLFASTAPAQNPMKGLQLGTPLPKAPVVTPMPSATPKPPAFAQQATPRKPIPLGWKLAIVGGALVVSVGLLIVAARAWRKSNLFDRQYRFPPAKEVALRLGAVRSGGCIAAIEFRGKESPSEDA